MRGRPKKARSADDHRAVNPLHQTLGEAAPQHFRNPVPRGLLGDDELYLVVIHEAGHDRLGVADFETMPKCDSGVGRSQALMPALGAA